MALKICPAVRSILGKILGKIKDNTLLSVFDQGTLRDLSLKDQIEILFAHKSLLNSGLTVRTHVCPVNMDTGHLLIFLPNLDLRRIVKSGKRAADKDVHFRAVRNGHLAGNIAYDAVSVRLYDITRINGCLDVLRADRLFCVLLCAGVRRCRAVRAALFLCLILRLSCVLFLTAGCQRQYHCRDQDDA